MEIVEIRNLDGASALSGTDRLPVQQGAALAHYTTLAGILSWINAQLAAGTLTVAAGAAGAPAICIGDDNTGIYGATGSLRFAIDGVEMLRLTAAGLAIGAGYDPAAYLHIKRASASALATIEGDSAGTLNIGRAGANASGPFIIGRKSRGTVDSPAAVAQNDVLANFAGVGHSGSGFVTGGLAFFKARAATPGPADMETTFVVQVCPAGSVTASEILAAAHATGLQLFGSTVIDQNRHLCLRSYTVATLPAASTASRVIYVSDGTSNKRVAVSDGTNWRWPDGAIVS